ncbi:MAG: helix-turn-helix transcriptional regulator [Pseudomonadota bacterium]|jgi:DNA-binding CsgD family transcriptional regulator|nr:helix-turn-helix transcriptional regulator [Alphaproteobacteria bacterium]
MIKIANNHPLLQLGPKVKESSNDFFKTYNLNYFQYLRCYRDGSIACLLSDPSLFLKFINSSYIDKPVVFSSMAKEQSYWFLWDEKLPREPIVLAKEEKNWNHGLTLVKRYPDYYDMIAVAMSEASSSSSSYYMSHLETIKTFMINFPMHAPDLFQAIVKNPIFLPEQNRDINYQKMCLKGDQRRSFGNVHITPQELKCLTLRLQGFSHKEIANMCDLSSRTVETYLNRIKSRSGFSNKRKLRELLQACK